MKTYTLYLMELNHLKPLAFGDWDTVADFLEEHLDDIVGWIHGGLEGEEQTSFEIWHEYARENVGNYEYMVRHLEVMDHSWLELGIMEQETDTANAWVVEKLTRWLEYREDNQY